MLELVAKLLTILAEVGVAAYEHATGEDVKAELLALGQSLEASITKLSGGKLADLLDAADDAALAARIPRENAARVLTPTSTVALPAGLSGAQVARLLGYDDLLLFDRDAGQHAERLAAGGDYALVAA